jgi:hypothetical protein
MKRKTFVIYLAPIIVLWIASTILVLADVSIIFSYTCAALLIVAGALLAYAGLCSATEKASSTTLSKAVERKEFYGVVAVLLGWFQIWIVHFISRLDQINIRIDKILEFASKR